MPRGIPFVGYRRRRMADGTLVSPMEMERHLASLEKQDTKVTSPVAIPQTKFVPPRFMKDNHGQIEVIESHNNGEDITEVRSSFIINPQLVRNKGYAVEHVLSLDFSPTSDIKVNNVSRFRKKPVYGNVINLKAKEVVKEAVSA